LIFQKNTNPHACVLRCSPLLRLPPPSSRPMTNFEDPRSPSSCVRYFPPLPTPAACGFSCACSRFTSQGASACFVPPDVPDNIPVIFPLSAPLLRRSLFRPAQTVSVPAWPASSYSSKPRSSVSFFYVLAPSVRCQVPTVPFRPCSRRPTVLVSLRTRYDLRKGAKTHLYGRFSFK